MVLKEEYKTSADTSIILNAEEKEKEELEFGKRHQNSMYQILKYNPIDPLYDLYRRGIAQLNLEEIEGKLGWDGMMKTTKALFDEIGEGKLSQSDIIKKVVARKIKMKAPKFLMKLDEMAAFLKGD